jgi:hypothetical protein
LLFGKPDPVFLDAEGALIVMDTKRCNRAVMYGKDIIQISAYATILSHAPAPGWSPLSGAA